MNLTHMQNKERTNYMKTILLSIIFFFMLTPTILAQNWWQVNSLSIDELPDKVLFHAEGVYSLDMASGTISGFLHNGEAGIQVRKNRLLLNLSTDLKYQKLELGPQVIREKYYLVEGAFIYDLLPNLHAEAGAIWEKDDQQFVDQRLIMYTGMNVQLFSSQRWGFNVMGAFGEQREKNVGSPNINVDWVGYGQQNFRLTLHPKIIFTEKFIFVQKFGDDSSYRNMLRLQTVFRFAPHVSALVKHETKYEQVPLFPGIEKINQFLTVGVRFDI